LGPLDALGETLNDVRKLSRCPAAHPPGGQLPGEERINPSVAAVVEEKEKIKNAVRRVKIKADVQISFRIRLFKIVTCHHYTIWLQLVCDPYLVLDFLIA